MEVYDVKACLRVTNFSCTVASNYLDTDIKFHYLSSKWKEMKTPETLRKNEEIESSQLTDWLPNRLIDWLVDWLIDWLIAWIADWLIGWLAQWLVDCLMGWLVDWLINWLSGLLLDCLVGWLIS